VGVLGAAQDRGGGAVGDARAVHDPSMPATLGEALIFSSGTSLRNCALGFLAPLCMVLVGDAREHVLELSRSTPYFSA
jgi:hypothetical protein